MGKDCSDNDDKENKHIRGVMDGAPAYQVESMMYVVPNPEVGDKTLQIILRFQRTGESR